MLLFSVLIPNYNYGHFLEDCLNSVAAQSLSARCFEVLLADDGSTDDSLTRVKGWAEAHPQVVLRVLPGAHAGHPGAVRNRAAREAAAPWLLCLDADDLLEEGALAAFASAIAAQPAPPSQHSPLVVLAAGCVEVRDQHVRPVAVPPFDEELVRRQHPCSNAVCYPLALWRAVGGYHERNPYEDWDFLVRSVALGAVWQGVPGAVYCYRQHEGSVSHGAQREDVAAKADIVLRSAHFFAPEVVWWAQQVQGGVPWVIPFPRGIIPSAENLHQWHAQCVACLGENAARFFPKELFAI